MPAPISWEPCPESADVDGCRRVTTEWSDGEGWPIAVELALDMNAEGSPRLQMVRLAVNGDYGDAQSYVEWVIGAVDGELDFAMRSRFPMDCKAMPSGMSDTAFAFRLRGPEKDEDALMLANLGELTPSMPYRDDENPGTSAWFLGGEWLVKLDYGSKVTAFPSDDLSAGFPLYGPSMNPDGTGYGGRPLFFGRDILFPATSYIAASIWAYDDERGPHPLISFPGDGTRGAANIGSDGKDMVWTYGEGKAPYEFGLYPTVSIMTAPFTTDPAALRPRRLRRDMSLGIGTQELQFAVGCGFAGRNLSGPGAEIVRLSDGAAWVLAGSDMWKYETVLGLTCEEVFVSVHEYPSGDGRSRRRS